MVKNVHHIQIFVNQLKQKWIVNQKKQMEYANGMMINVKNICIHVTNSQLKKIVYAIGILMVNVLHLLVVQIMIYLIVLLHGIVELLMVYVNLMNMLHVLIKYNVLDIINPKQNNVDSTMIMNVMHI